MTRSPVSFAFSTANSCLCVERAENPGKSCKHMKIIRKSQVLRGPDPETVPPPPARWVAHCKSS